MTPTTFSNLYQELQELYEQKAYSAALLLANEGLDQHPESRTILDYWRIMLSARTGNLAGALDAFSTALDHGSWYSELLLRRSPILKDLQDDPLFERLLARNQEIAEHDPENHYPYFVLRHELKCQSGGPPCSLLIGLHTNGGTVQDSIDFWKPAAAHGWLVAAPQSSQTLMKGAHVWDDRLVAEQEILNDYASLQEHYSINPWQTVLAGHSLGAETAIWLSVKGTLDTRCFLAINPAGPWIDDLKPWEKMLKDHLRPEMRGYFIVGELGETVDSDQIAELVEMFNLAGIEAELEIVPSAENDYVPAYDPAIRRGLNFLTE